MPDNHESEDFFAAIGLFAGPLLLIAVVIGLVAALL